MNNKDKIPREKYLQDQIHNIVEHMWHLEKKISMYWRKFTSSIHNRTLILFKKGRLQDWRDSYHWVILDFLNFPAS